MCLDWFSGDTSDVNGSEGALSELESHMFGFPIGGGAPSLLPRRPGVRARLRAIRGGSRFGCRRHLWVETAVVAATACEAR